MGSPKSNETAVSPSTIRCRDGDDNDVAFALNEDTLPSAIVDTALSVLTETS